MKNQIIKSSCLGLLFILISIVGYSQSKVLTYLNSISGSKTLAGEHNREPNSNPAQYTNQIFSTTGKYPALWSGDFLFASSDISARQTMINMAKTQWNAGAAINIMYHACPPTQGEPCGWDGGVVSKLSDADWNSLVTNGSALNNTWKARLDVIAGYLQDLKNSGVEVLFRPFHEMNQGVFWWAGRTGSNGTLKLYQITHDYLVNTKGLTNLIWVWDLQDFGSLSSDLNNYDPGSSYWDVLAMDMYSSDGQGYTSSKYNAMVSKAGSKPIAIGECQVLPTSSLLSSQPRWTFFMGWSELVFSNNTTAAIQSVYGAANVLTRDEMPGWAASGGGGTGTVPANLATNRPVTVSSTEAGANVAANAVDNSYTTRWSSAYADPQWITVDLGSNYNVNRVKITWEAAYGKNYLVQYSTDNSTWTTAKTVTNNTSLTNDNTGLTGTARYVRIYGTARATTFGYSIFALEVYGTAASGGGGGTTNLAFNRPVTTTSNENTTNTGAMAVDANGTTRWSSSYANNQNFIVDLGANYNVSRVKIAWEAAYATSYQIQVSTDNSTWTTIKSITGKSSSATDDLTGLTGTARYVKAYCITRATAYGFSFFEFEVYGTLSGGRSASTEEVTNTDGEQGIATAYPNPMTGKTTIAVNLPKDGHTVISVSGSLGNKVAELHNGPLEAGLHEFNFNADNLPAGLYLYTIIFDGRRTTKKLIK